MRVFKFGGASIKDAEAIKNVGTIIQTHQTEPLLVVVSASGKMTNALERVLNAYWKQDQATMQAELTGVRQHHETLLATLFPNPEHPVYTDIHDTFIDLDWILEEIPQDPYDYLYDQIVSAGELLSTKIVAAYLNSIQVSTAWLDVRDCIKTDNTYRAAKVDWESTNAAINKVVPKLLETGLVLTQGFLGGTSENFTTTLGREGSDFTAAIFSHCLEATTMTIWKDVPGVLTADPRLFNDATLLPQLSYAEAIELTYNGAQVIHPKTIYPLQVKQIPMYVKSFINPEGAGTAIGHFENLQYPPMIIVKKNQTLLHIVSKALVFLDEAKFAALFAAFAECGIQCNVIQNTALAFSVCIDQMPLRNERLIALLEADYEVEQRDNLRLMTVRYADEAMLERVYQQSPIYLEEKIKGNIQLVIDANSDL